MTEPDPQYVELKTQLAQLAQDDPAAAALIEQLHSVYLGLVRGGVTASGLPYPDPTDPISEGADAIRALAEAIGANDHPWTNVTPASGWTTGTGTAAFAVMRQGGIVFQRGGFNGGTLGQTAGTLPVWARPVSNATPQISSGSGATSYMSLIASSGAVQPFGAMLSSNSASWPAV